MNTDLMTTERQRFHVRQLKRLSCINRYAHIVFRTLRVVGHRKVIELESGRGRNFKPASRSRKSASGDVQALRCEAGPSANGRQLVRRLAFS
jgi:hypothetical protein